jgi:hypothetical protein
MHSYEHALLNCKVDKLNKIVYNFHYRAADSDKIEISADSLYISPVC